MAKGLQIKGVLWAWVGVLIVCLAVPFLAYGTLEPCGMLEAEIKRRVEGGDLLSLSQIPGLITNSNNQMGCMGQLIGLYTE